MSSVERILITGSNRGIGFELVRYYLQRDDVRIFAAAQADDLNQLVVEKRDRLIVVEMEVTDWKMIAKSVDIVKQHVDGLDILINNAGLRHENAKERFGAINADEMLQSFEVHTVAPTMIVQAFLDLLKTGNRARIINISSNVGGVTTVEGKGRPFDYCVSKAALNMATRIMSTYLADDGIITVCMHPGWVQTEMGYTGGPNPPLTPEESARGLGEVIDGLSVQDNNRFLQWDGSECPW